MIPSASAPDRSPPSRRPILGWFLLALGLSWAAWIPFAAAEAGRIAIRVPAELVWLGEYSPSIAALLLIGWREGRAGLRRLGARLVRWRVPALWYAVAVLTTPLVAALTLAAVTLVRGPVDWSRLAGWDHRFVERTAGFTPSLGLVSGLVQLMETGPVATAFVFVGLAITNGGLSEELGWRGYVLPELTRRRGPLMASLGVAVLWGLWHTGPGFWGAILTTGGAEAARFTAGYLAQYLGLVIPLSVLYTWLYRRSGESLLLVVVLHASYNLTVTLVTGAWPDFPLGWFLVVFYVIAGAIAVSPDFRARPLAVDEPFAP